jgi:DNA ligase (NAD+)
VEELIEMENVGEITARAIVEYFQDENNVAELDALFSAGVTPTWTDEKKEGIFTGESVVLTGTLTNYKRSEAQKLIEARGGVCQSSVTAKTTLVLAGEEAGSKLEKAQKLGIKIIDEATFKQMLEREDLSAIIGQTEQTEEKPTTAAQATATQETPTQCAFDLDSLLGKR